MDHKDSPYPERRGDHPTAATPPSQDGVPYTTVFTQPVYTQPLPGYQNPQAQPYIPPSASYQRTYYGTPVESSPGYFDMEHYRSNWDSATTGALIVFLAGLIFPFVWCMGFFFVGPGQTRTTRTFGYASITAMMIYAILALIIGIVTAIHNA